MSKYDCIIIGSGPGGLSAAIYLGRTHRKTLVVNSGPKRTAHAVHIQNYMGFEDITGEQLLAKATEQAKKYGVEFLLATVRNLKKEDGQFTVETASEKLYADAVVVASGINDVMPAVDNIFDFLGKTFFTCLDCDGYHLTNRTVCLVGNGESVAKRALFVKKVFNAKITIFVDKKDDIPRKYLQRLEQGEIDVVEKKIVHFNGKDGMIESVLLDDGSEFECEAVHTGLGYARNDLFLKEMDIKRSETGYYITDENYESSVPGLFIVGPLNTGPDQVSVAVGEGARAAMQIVDLLFE